MPTNPVLQAALNYASRGWHVLPLHGIRDGACTCGQASDAPDHTPGKHPLTRHGLLDASNQRQQLWDWFEARPWANLAIATGASGHAVLDVDPRKGGLDSLRRLGVDMTRAGKVQTGDGWHLYFQGPASTSAGELGSGLDVRGIGGYVVAPPSRHLSGATYRWLRLELPLPPWPFHGSPAVLNRPTPSLQEGILEGSRNATLFRIAGSLRRWDIPGSAILRALQVVNEEVCRPPMPRLEVTRIAQKIMQRPPHGRLYATPSTAS